MATDATAALTEFHTAASNATKMLERLAVAVIALDTALTALTAIVTTHTTTLANHETRITALE